MWIVVIIILTTIGIFIAILEGNNQNKVIETNHSVDFSKFITTNYVMTKTELIFYRELKKITDKYDVSIFPQVDLERFVRVKDNDRILRNRIKSRSIDFVVVRNSDCKILFCIELDDNSHMTKKAQESDHFKNQIFKKIKIPLYRIKVSNYYNLDELEKKFKKL